MDGDVLHEHSLLSMQRAGSSRSLRRQLVAIVGIEADIQAKIVTAKLSLSTRQSPAAW